MEIHGGIGGVVGVGVGVVGYEGVLLTCLGRAGFWCWASFCYLIFVARVFLFQLLDLAVGLSIIVAKHLDWSEEIPVEDEQEHNFKGGRTLHVEQVKVLIQVMEVFVI